MNTIKSLVGIAVISLALMGFISMDPAFKNASKVQHSVKELSKMSDRLNINSNTNVTENVTLNFTE